ncbi:beta-1,6-N-acetylglucosaminyltransferase [Acetanaerobacterium elongatum]|uniref:Peptide O-xylosyltransferase n=1 Tax=Acetanaerobacterium elongatum TaxID=258515 RepID=A0A1H0EVL6_9FIRM|nr:beta-1,6-N-acetylglucosaminyltransferase [Acetanaerobacterium elongatum]SDN86408.1 Core-2/I-Branching enzyme [Acetanaerobacterium elongatum]
MNIAYCIICHRNTNILRTTIALLSKENDIYLHVDKKACLTDFDEYQGRVFFIRNRVNVQWGAYSQIEAMLALFSEAIKGNYDYYCLLSGDDLPLKNSAAIKEFISRNDGAEYIGIVKDFEKLKPLFEQRLKYKHSRFSLKRTKSLPERALFKLYKIMRLNRRPNRYYCQLPPLYKGANWLCITKQLLEYIFNYLNANPWYQKAFKHGCCGDEIFFQTIVMNSEFKDKIYHYETELDDNRMALRYIDWVSGPQFPKILSEQDLPRMKDTDCIFARKFKDDLDIDVYKREMNITE